MKKSTKIFAGIATAVGTALTIGGICNLFKKDADEVEEVPDDSDYDEGEDENVEDSEEDE